MSVRLKTLVVEDDEHEQNGLRYLLNYGHTAGHAIEAASSYQWSHGRAIAAGMLVAATLGYRLHLTSSAVLADHQRVLSRMGFDIRITRSWIPSIMKFLMQDKKRIGRNLKWVLLRDFGKPCIVSNIPMNLVQRTLLELQ